MRMFCALVKNVNIYKEIMRIIFVYRDLEK